MKNTKRVLRASEAERIRKVLEDCYFEMEVNYLIIQDDREDDPGDYYSDTAAMNKIATKQERILKAAEAVGGINTRDIYRKAHMKAFGW